MKIRRHERLEWVRRLLLEGVPEWKLHRLFSEPPGFNIAPPLPDGKENPVPQYILVSRSTVKKDLLAVGKEWRELHNDPEVQERVAGAAIERLTNIAAKAEGAGQYHSAIRANEVILKYLGVRAVRWDARMDADERGKLDDGPITVGELDDLSDDELMVEYQRRHQRAEQVGVLRLVKGGK